MTAINDVSTGTGDIVRETAPTITSPVLVTPALGTPSALVLTNATGLPIAGGGTGAATAIAAGDALNTKGANIASATTTDLSTATGRFVHITGTTQITGFGTATAGVERVLVFDGILEMVHNATSLILPAGGVNITTAANDCAIMISEGSGNWRCVSYQKADGTAIA